MKRYVLPVLLAAFLAGCTNTRTPAPPQPYVVQVDADGEWLWQITASNNVLIAESVRGFRDPQDALDNLNAVRAALDAHESPRLIRDRKL